MIWFIILNIFLVCPIWLPLFSLFLCAYVIASIAYIHPLYSAGVQTHYLLIMSHLPQQLDRGSRIDLINYYTEQSRLNVTYSYMYSFRNFAEILQNKRKCSSLIILSPIFFADRIKKWKSGTCNVDRIEKKI